MHSSTSSADIFKSMPSFYLTSPCHVHLPPLHLILTFSHASDHSVDLCRFHSHQLICEYSDAGIDALSEGVIGLRSLSLSVKPVKEALAAISVLKLVVVRQCSKSVEEEEEVAVGHLALWSDDLLLR